MRLTDERIDRGRGVVKGTRPALCVIGAARVAGCGAVTAFLGAIMGG